MSKINQTTWIVALSTIDSTTVDELVEPEVPGIVTITNPEGGKIINFTAGTEGTSPITSYVATSVPEGPTLTVVSPDLAIGGYVELSNFTFDTDYIVSISAVNEVGQGEAASTNSFIIEDVYNAANGGTETIVYDYNGTGERWKVHTFESNGTLEITESPQPFSTLIVAGGNGANYYVGTPASGGEVIENIGTLSNSQVSVVVGSGGAGGQGGNAQSGGFSQFGSDTANAGLSNVQVNSTITGVSTPYGGNGSYPIARGRGGMGAANTGEGGTAGIVVVSYEISNAFNAAIGGNEVIVDDYNGTGEQWMVHTFTSSGAFEIVNNTNPFRVLTVAGGGGAGGGSGNNAQGWTAGGGGSGGVLSDDALIIPVGSSTAVTVGVGGAGGGPSASGASPNGGNGGNSSVGDLIVATGGGAGGQTGRSGGSGGGGGFANATGGGGAGILGQGTNGGSGGGQSGGGGQGAGAGDGSTVSTSYAGRVSNITGADVTYSARYGGIGGGGAGNTRWETTGASGKAGRVIIAYQIGESTLAQIKVAQTVRKAELRKQQLAEKALKKQEALEAKLKK
jgi:hypothetical protein